MLRRWRCWSRWIHSSWIRPGRSPRASPASCQSSPCRNRMRCTPASGGKPGAGERASAGRGHCRWRARAGNHRRRGAGLPLDHRQGGRRHRGRPDGGPRKPRAHRRTTPWRRRACRAGRAPPPGGADRDVRRRERQSRRASRAWPTPSRRLPSRPSGCCTRTASAS